MQKFIFYVQVGFLNQNDAYTTGIHSKLNLVVAESEDKAVEILKNLIPPNVEATVEIPKFPTEEAASAVGHGADVTEFLSSPNKRVSHQELIDLYRDKYNNYYGEIPEALKDINIALWDENGQVKILNDYLDGSYKEETPEGSEYNNVFVIIHSEDEDKLSGGVAFSGNRVYEESDSGKKVIMMNEILLSDATFEKEGEEQVFNLTSNTQVKLTIKGEILVREYVEESSSWTEWRLTPIFVPEAPEDGKWYVRTDASWLALRFGTVDENNDKLVTSKNIKRYVDTAVIRVYRYQGSKTPEEISAIISPTIGDVYNVKSSGFIEVNGTSCQVHEGDNVAWDGTRWDNLNGIFDLSDYVKFTDYAKEDTAGAVKVKKGSGLSVDTNGNLSVTFSNFDQVKLKQDPNSTISAKTVDYAIVTATHSNMSDSYDPSTISCGELKEFSKDKLPVSYEAAKNYTDGKFQTKVDSTLRTSNKTIPKAINEAYEKIEVVATSLVPGWNTVKFSKKYSIAWVFVGKPMCYNDEGKIVEFEIRNTQNFVVDNVSAFEIYAEEDCELECAVTYWNVVSGLFADYMLVSCKSSDGSASKLSYVMTVDSSSFSSSFGDGYDIVSEDDLHKILEITSLDNNGADKQSEVPVDFIPVTYDTYPMGIEAPEGLQDVEVSGINDWIYEKDEAVYSEGNTLILPAGNKFVIRTSEDTEAGIYMISLQTLDNNRNKIRIETQDGYYGEFQSPQYGLEMFEDSNSDYLVVYLRSGENHITVRNMGNSSASIGGIKLFGSDTISSSQSILSECKVILQEELETEPEAPNKMTYDGMIPYVSNRVNVSIDGGNVLYFNHENKDCSVDLTVGVPKTGYYNITAILGSSTGGNSLSDELEVISDRGEVVTYSTSVNGGGFDFVSAPSSLYLIKGDRKLTFKATTASKNGIFLRGIDLVETVDPSEEEVIQNTFGAVTADNAPYTGIYRVCTGEGVIDMMGNTSFAGGYVYLLSGHNDITFSSIESPRFKPIPNNGLDMISRISPQVEPTSNIYVLGDALYGEGSGNIVDYVTEKDENVVILDNSLNLPSNSRVVLRTPHISTSGLYHISIQILNEVSNKIRVETSTGYYGEFRNPRISGKQTHYENGVDDLLVVYLREGENLITLINEGASNAVVGGLCCSKSSPYTLDGNYATNNTIQQFQMSECKIIERNTSNIDVEDLILNALSSEITYDAPYTGVYTINIQNSQNLDLSLTTDTGHKVSWVAGENSAKYIYLVEGLNSLHVESRLISRWTGDGDTEEFLVDLRELRSRSQSPVSIEMFSACLQENLHENISVQVSLYEGKIDLKSVTKDSENRFELKDPCYIYPVRVSHTVKSSEVPEGSEYVATYDKLAKATVKFTSNTTNKMSLSVK